MCTLWTEGTSRAVVGRLRRSGRRADIHVVACALYRLWLRERVVRRPTSLSGCRWVYRAV